MEDGDGDDNQKQKNSSFVIQIPSYEQVIESSQSKATPSSLFNPSTSFSQAFNFIKNSDFYTPPPPPVPPPDASPSNTPPPRWLSISIFFLIFAFSCEVRDIIDIICYGSGILVNRNIRLPQLRYLV